MVLATSYYVVYLLCVGGEEAPHGILILSGSCDGISYIKEQTKHTIPQTTHLEMTSPVGVEVKLPDLDTQLGVNQRTSDERNYFFRCYARFPQEQKLPPNSGLLTNMVEALSTLKESSTMDDVEYLLIQKGLKPVLDAQPAEKRLERTFTVRPRLFCLLLTKNNTCGNNSTETVPTEIIPT